jgi:hypothetical protein
VATVASADSNLTAIDSNLMDAADECERGTRIDLVWLTYPNGAMSDAAAPQARRQANELLISLPKITLVLLPSRAPCLPIKGWPRRRDKRGDS